MDRKRKLDKKDLPKEVFNSFQKSYPNATIKGASMENEEGKIYYEIESVDGKQTQRFTLYRKWKP